MQNNGQHLFSFLEGGAWEKAKDGEVKRFSLGPKNQAINKDVQ